MTPVLKSLHWLKIEQRVQYKVASITYKVLQSEQPSNFHSLVNVPSNRTITCLSNIITLQRPSVHSRLTVTDRSFTHHSPVLWYFLPKQLRQPSIGASTITRHCYWFYSSTCPVLASVSLSTQNFSLWTILFSFVLFAPTLVGSLVPWPS